MMPYSPLELRFWSKVDRKSDLECWPWMSYRNPAGYGSFWLPKPIKSMKLAHRVAWELTHGSIPRREGPEEIFVCHKCDVQECCNPSHLFLGTHQDNVDDRERKGRNVIARHRGVKNGSCKLSEENVREIFHSKLTAVKLASIFKVSDATVSLIRRRKLWAHLEMGEK